MGLVEIANIPSILDGFSDIRELRSVLQEISFRLNRANDIQREMKALKNVVADVAPVTAANLKKRHSKMTWHGEQSTVAQEVGSVSEIIVVMLSLLLLLSFSIDLVLLIIFLFAQCGEMSADTSTTFVEFEFVSMEREEKFFLCFDLNPEKCDWYVMLHGLFFVFVVVCIRCHTTILHFVFVLTGTPLALFATPSTVSLVTSPPNKLIT